MLSKCLGKDPKDTVWIQRTSNLKELKSHLLELRWDIAHSIINNSLDNFQIRESAFEDKTVVKNKTEKEECTPSDIELNTDKVTTDDGVKQKVTLTAKMGGKAIVKRNSDVEFTLSLPEMIKFSAITVEFPADKKKREYECKVLNIDIGGKNFVKYEWRDG